MKYMVSGQIKVRTKDGERALLAGQIISMPADKAAALLLAGKITEMHPRPHDLHERDRLFHEHTERLSLYPFSPEKIPAALWEMIRESNRQLDTAWMSGSIDDFKRGMAELETLCIRAYYHTIRKHDEN
ncbi:MAG: hypothetical protein K8I29_08730 [Alphaproteobacteria bacterium]|uniref:Uncharacterized protein n=1 Tax=Candidatus Nitrobium versatile TaxID=2884831 RepID=A0A953JEK3_9BACT|nr:hypothetical protein [Candidatus Nitrobium versatile]